MKTTLAREIIAVSVRETQSAISIVLSCLQFVDTATIEASERFVHSDKFIISKYLQPDTNCIIPEFVMPYNK